jgi:hypothetical protein
MLKAFAAGVLLTIAMPTGWVEAKDTPGDLPPCTTGNVVGAPCDCGTADSGHPVRCHAGQWCHPSGTRTLANFTAAAKKPAHSSTGKIRSSLNDGRS